MKFRLYLFLRILVCFAVLLASLQSVGFADSDKPDNYLLGMTVRKTFTGDYFIKLRFKNTTKNKYKLKELGNNTYSLILPQVRSEIGEHDIYFENEHDDLKIVFSEKKDLVSPESFCTQINFRTKHTSFLRIQALAESSKVSNSEIIDVSTNDLVTKKHLSRGIIFFILAFIFGTVALFFLRQKAYKPYKETDKLPAKQEDESYENSASSENSVTDEQNDTSLTEDSENNNDLSSFDNNVETEKKGVVFPDRSSIEERFKNRNLEKDIEDLIFLEREAFLERMSPFSDIISSSDNQNNNDEEDNIQSQYDKLMNAFKNVLKIAHKITDDSLVPEVTDAFAISETVGFCMVQYGEKTSLVGNIKDKVFLIRTFSQEELNDDTLFMEFCTETSNSQTYSVILNNFKALIRVTDSNISLIEDYTG